jgi:hypothetical protein
VRKAGTESPVKTIYFAHAMTDYDTVREAKVLHMMQQAGWEVVNPNTAQHAAAVQAMRTAGHNVMDYFCGLVRDADATAFMLTEQGEIGPGVLKEVCEAFVWGKPVFWVGVPYEKGVMKPLKPNEFVSYGAILTIAEMRERVSLRNLNKG